MPPGLHCGIIRNLKHVVQRALAPNLHITPSHLISESDMT